MQAQPVRKTIGGVTFEDRFAHLQTDSDEALAWQWERDEAARQASQGSPNFSPIRDRLVQLGALGAAYTAPRKRGALWFGFAVEDDGQVVRASEEPNGPGLTVVSQSAISKAHDGGLVMMVRVEASPRGRYAAVGWGLNGDMLGTWSVYETATGSHVRDVPAILYSGSAPAWLPDESGFWLAGRSAEGEHKLGFVAIAPGAAERPDVLLEGDLVAPVHSGLNLQIAPDGKSGVVVTEPHEHVALVHLDLETLDARPFLPDGFHGECDAGWIDNRTYVARANNDMPRGRIVAIPAETSRDISTWREIVPESEGYIAWAGVVGGRIYVGDLVDLSLRVRVFDRDGALIETLPLENPGSSPLMTSERAIRPTDALAFTHATFTRSAVLLVHDPLTGKLDQIGEAKERLDGVVADQRFAVSRDGTRIPYFVVRGKDLDPTRPQPTLVYAYGGFNVSLLPNFPANFTPFIEAGGIFVQASLRGGGEYGKAWHDGGRLFNKQNTFDDLRAVAEALIADGLSTPEQMAFYGASNGGLLAGNAIVFQADLWRVVVPHVPIFDIMEMLPLTAENAPVRAIMYEDYGDTSVPEVARSVFTWSPYHNIRDGVAYPAVYQIFGEHDVGCMPFQGRKFTARLEEADAGSRPIHLRVWRNAGHGVLDPACYAEWLAFVMDQIGMTAKLPA